MKTVTLREAIIMRVQGKSEQDIREVIEDSVGNAEVTLPGLGVLFEIIWTHSDPGLQGQMIATLHGQLPQEAPSAEA
ncbi:small acid-soluble spore protein SspI [Cohnella sp. REN36]|uniref:small acid-soluble spore protein SspI n=1 Tax=Cohnella sp. REN36 TaxID=2887347 RepID=UPI001D14F0E4|nr:small acid-soluble spore protein SspI [Cohnella sp. REN36]MCC3377046.1 small acid-soluble spore protein SspI [Cohnella sp. REN36]